MVQTRLKRKPPWTNETSDGSGVLETERTRNSPLLVFFFLPFPPFFVNDFNCRLWLLRHESTGCSTNQKVVFVVFVVKYRLFLHLGLELRNPLAANLDSECSGLHCLFANNSLGVCEKRTYLILK
jgi:hypothetical protein